MVGILDDNAQNALNPTLESARAIVAATTQIDLALREAQEPVEQLGASISSIGLALIALNAARGGNKGGGADDTMDFQVERELTPLQAELARAIEALQFHDRLFQHLSHVRDYLTGVSLQLANVAALDRESDPAGSSQLDAAAWYGLRERLFQRLISDPQRQMLDMMLPQTDDNRQMTSATCRINYAAQGTTELF